MKPNSVPEGNLLISLDVMETVDAEQGLAFMHALLFQLRQVPEIGSQARIEIVHLSRGTIWAQVAIIVGTLVAGTGVVRVAVDSIKTELEQGTGPLAKETARTLHTYRGENCTIITHDDEITISIRAMPAQAIIAEEPPVPPEGFAYVRERGAYVQDEGNYVVAPRAENVARSPEGLRDRVYTNIPADGVAELTGQVTLTGSELRFVQPDGTYGRIDEVLTDEQPPEGLTIIAMVSATRGDHGGYADRGVAIHEWKPAQAEKPVSAPASEPGRSLHSVGAATPSLSSTPDLDNAEPVALVGQLDNSFGTHSFEFVSKNGDTYFADEADDFTDMIALGQDVFIEATLVYAEEGPLLYVHRLRVID